jgi:hypothetical protein
MLKALGLILNTHKWEGGRKGRRKEGKGYTIFLGKCREGTHILILNNVRDGEALSSNSSPTKMMVRMMFDMELKGEF